MRVPRVDIDTNVIIAAMRSKRGASNRVLSLIGIGKFQIRDSVALVLEYEEVLQKQREDLRLTNADVDNLIDSLCSFAEHHEIFSCGDRPCRTRTMN